MFDVKDQTCHAVVLVSSVFVLIHIPFVLCNLHHPLVLTRICSQVIWVTKSTQLSKYWSQSYWTYTDFLAFGMVVVIQYVFQKSIFHLDLSLYIRFYISLH